MAALELDDEGYYAALLRSATSGVPGGAPVRVCVIPGKGKALVAARALAEGEVLLMEEPLVSMQALSNTGRAPACSHCHTRLGTLVDQVDACVRVEVPDLLIDFTPAEEASHMRSTYDAAFPRLPVDFALPAMDAADAVLCAAVPCTYACGHSYCSERCREKAWNAYHWLLCTSFAEPAASAALSVPEAPAGDASINTSVLLTRQARMTHEVLLLAARILARVCILAHTHAARTGRGVLECVGIAMRPFESLHTSEWWRCEVLRVRGGEMMDAGGDDEEDESVEHASPRGASAAASAASHGAHIVSVDDAAQPWVAGVKADLENWVADAGVVLRAQLRRHLPAYLQHAAASRTARAERVLAAAIAAGHADPHAAVAQELGPPLAESVDDAVIERLVTAGAVERLMAACELNSLELKVDSPLHDYFRALASMKPTQGKRRRRGGRARGGDRGRGGKVGAPSSAVAERYAAVCSAWEPVLARAEAAREARHALQRALYRRLAQEKEKEAHAAAEGDAHEAADKYEHRDDASSDDVFSSDDDASSTDSDDDGPLSSSRIRRIFPCTKGSCVFALISTINHSCQPNVQVSYLGGSHVAALVAQHDIAEGEELCINYVDIQQPVDVRRGELLRYGFTCMCERCVSEAS